MATGKVQVPVSISTRFSVATGLLFQQASLGILNSNAHFNALKQLPPWSLCPPLPLLFTCHLALEEPLGAFSKLFGFKPWANPPPHRCQAALLSCEVLDSITGKSFSPSSFYLSGTPVLVVEDSSSHFPPLCAVFHSSSEDHLLLVSNPRLCLGMDSKGSPSSLNAFFSCFNLVVTL